jgi:two-component system phosphate regulon sensor histidine kinase PhoR
MSQDVTQNVIEALRRAEKMRIEFVANVSHELRTPMTSIKGYAETLLQDFEDGRTIDPEFLKIILKNSNRLIALINDLLDLSAIESGVDQINLCDLDTAEISKHVVSNLDQHAKSKQIKISVETGAQTVHADPKRVEQVMTNLVDNAIKYCPAKSTIKIQWTEVGDEVVLKVVDNGPGIPEKYLGRLFERFYRVDKGRSRETGGTGLGLAIVKHIMQRHGGTALAESIVGVGTTFICKFPVAASSQGELL